MPHAFNETTNMNGIKTSSREREIYRITLAGSVVNIVLTAAKMAAGIWGHSSAMIADAVHSLSDLATDVIVIFFVRLSGKPEDKSHDYGHGKYETFATLLIGAALLAVAAGICIDGAGKIMAFVQGERLERPGWIALAAALVSIAAKEALFRRTRTVGKRQGSPAVIANAWHHRSDALSSVGTAAGIGGAILLGENWRVLDPLAAVVVSIFIARVAVRLAASSIGELTEQSLPEEVEREITAAVLSVDGVLQPHHLRTRRIGSRYAIEMHVRMDGGLTLRQAHDKATQIENKLKEMYGAGTHVGIHVEPEK